MANELPDPARFEAWDEAFQFPIPVVRRLERRLESDIAANQGKLRTLVGASHDELLSTAERIVDMNDNIKYVDNHMAMLGRKCNTGILEKKKRNYVEWMTGLPGRDKQSYAMVARISVLNGCSNAISRLLRRRGSVLVASKILVLSRLLQKTLSQDSQTPPFVETIRIKLGSLRRKLLAQIDKQMLRPNIDMEGLIEALCACSLATSSSLTDVLRHFHDVRLGRMVEQLSLTQNCYANVVASLRLFIRTLQDTYMLLLRRLSDALRRLHTRQLIEDADVKSVLELKLDVHERWIPNEVRKFVPWIRQDDVQRSQASEILQKWARQAFQAFTDGFGTALLHFNDIEGLMNLRKDLIEIWLSSSSHITGISPSSILNTLRENINARLMRLTQERISGLKLIGDIALGIFSEIREHPELSHTQSLWDTSLVSMDFSRGAVTFKKAISDCHHGRDGHVLEVLNAYNSWLASVQKVHCLIEEMKSAKWEAPLDEVDGTMLEEDSEGADSEATTPRYLLNNVDPSLLETQFYASLTSAFSSMQSLLTGLLHDIPEYGTSIPLSIFLLRIIRAILGGCTESIFSSSPAETTTNLFQLIPPLHTRLAENVTRDAICKFADTFCKFLHDTSTNPQSSAGFSSLWEGEPSPLPVLPCPFTYRFLKAIVTNMNSAGVDVWNTFAVSTLKKVMKKEIKNALDQSMRDGEVEGDRATQALFDVMYIQIALSAAASKEEETNTAGTAGTADEADDALDGVAFFLADKGKIAPEERSRVLKNAADYWKRTELLFALLGSR